MNKTRKSFKLAIELAEFFRKTQFESCDMKDNYFRGMFNAFEVVCSTLEGREPCPLEPYRRSRWQIVKDAWKSLKKTF